MSIITKFWNGEDKDVFEVILRNTIESAFGNSFSSLRLKVSFPIVANNEICRIDVDKNSALAEALRVKGLPTLIVYKDGEMKWRFSGEQDANTLIGIIQKYI